MSSPYVIDSGVPMPLGLGSNGKTKYPFSGMKVGDSFFVPAGEASSKNVGMAAHCWARELRRKDPTATHKFATRTNKEPAGCRCWRIL